MINEIFNIVAPIAKTLIEECVCSAITEEHSPKKTENIYTGGEIVKSVIRNYNTMSQLDPNRDDNKTNNTPINIQYRGNTTPLANQNNIIEETPYSLAMKKNYKYNF